MTEPVKRYVTTCDCMSEAGWGDYVRHADYVRLAQECAHLREERDSFQRVGIHTMEERNAALKQVEGLRGSLEKAALAMWNSEANMDNEAAEAEVALSDAALQANPCATTK